MVNISVKPETHRLARVEGRILMASSTLERIRTGHADKGDVLAVARLAGIQAAKKTSDLIPLCHAIPLTRVTVDFEVETTPPAVRCTVTTEAIGRTGVEMEALTAVQVALLTIYDMCKAVDRGMRIDGVRLLEKSGGRSGQWKVDGQAP